MIISSSPFKIDNLASKRKYEPLEIANKIL